MAVSQTKKSIIPYDNGNYSRIEFPFFGFVTSGATLIDAYLLTPNLIIGKTISNLQINDVQARLPTGGYVADITTDKITDIANRGTYLRLNITKSGGWGVTNNIPITGVFVLSFTIS